MEEQLRTAAILGQKDNLKHLIDQPGINLNYRDKEGSTALYHASSQGYPKLVQLLLEKGADPSIKNNNGYTPQDRAANKSVKNVFLDHFDPNRPKGWFSSWFGGKKADPKKATTTTAVESRPSSTPAPTPAPTTPSSNNSSAPFSTAAQADLAKQLYQAAESNDVTKMRTILQTSIGIINFQNDNKETALLQAAYKGQLDAVRLLVEKGANMNIQDKFERTPLHWASSEGHQAIVKLLLEKGANTAILNRHGQTAQEIGKTQAVKDLFGNKPAGTSAPATSPSKATTASSSNTNSDALGQKLYDAANSADIPKLKELLNTSGVNINWVNANKESALIQACYKGHIEVVKILLDKNCNMDIKEKDGWTALHWASTKGHMEILRLLLQKGADASIKKNNGSTPAEIGKDQAVKDLFASFARSKGQAATTTNTNTNTNSSTSTSTPPPATNANAAELGQKLYDAANSADIPKLNVLLNTSGLNINWVNGNGESALLQACYKGHLAVVQLLVDMGANMNIKEKDGWTGLHWAAYKGHLAVVKLLLEKGADHTIRKNNGTTALEIATNQATKDVFATFFAQKKPAASSTSTSSPSPQKPAPAPTTPQTNASPNNKNAGNFDANLGTKLWDAANAGEVEKVRAMLGSPKLNIDHVNANGESSLIQSCYKGHTEVVKLLLAMGANRNIQDKDGWTALHWASSKGHMEILRLLLQKGADASIKKNNGSTPVDCAKDQAVKDVFAQYANNKSNSSTTSSTTTSTPPPSASKPAATPPSTSSLSADALGQKLYDAANSADIPKLKELLNTNGVNINWVNANKESALLQACYKGHVAVVELLLSKGANMNLKEKDGWTALHWAAYKGHIAVLKMLLDNGADVSIKKNNGSTAAEMSQGNQAVKDAFAAHALKQQQKPTYTAAELGAQLYAAAEKGDVQTVRTLLSTTSVNINHKNETGETALLQACYKNQIGSVTALLEKGANINLQTNDGWTPLHWAAFKGHTDMVKLLLNKGADYTLKKKSGTTALEVASDQAIKNLITAHINSKKPTLSISPATPAAPPKVTTTPAPAPPTPSTPALTKEQETELGNKLYEAAGSGDLAKVRELLNTPGININFKYQNSETALIQACYEGHLPVAQLLVEKGANLNLKDTDGWTALHWAAYKASVPITAFLLEKGADTTLESKKGSTAQEASRDPAIIEAFAAHQRKKNPSAAPPKAVTTTPKVAAPMTEAEIGEKLCEAAATGNTSAVRELLNTAGCNTNFTIAATGESALLRAASGGHVEALQLLLDKGADINLQDKSGRTALHNACIHARIDSAKLLLKRGASHYILDKDGLPPPQSNAAIKKAIDDHEMLLQPKLPPSSAK